MRFFHSRKRTSLIDSTRNLPSIRPICLPPAHWRDANERPLIQYNFPIPPRRHGSVRLLHLVGRKGRETTGNELSLPLLPSLPIASRSRQIGQFFCPGGSWCEMILITVTVDGINLSESYPSGPVCPIGVVRLSRGWEWWELKGRWDKRVALLKERDTAASFPISFLDISASGPSALIAMVIVRKHFTRTLSH